MPFPWHSPDHLQLITSWGNRYGHKIDLSLWLVTNGAIDRHDTDGLSSRDRAEVVAAARADVVDLHASHLRVGDQLWMEAVSQSGKQQPCEVIRLVSRASMPDLDESIDYLIEVALPARRRTTSSSKAMTTHLIGWSNDRLACVNVARAQEIDAGTYVASPLTDLDFTAPPIPDATASVAAEVGHGQHVAFPDPALPVRWLYGLAYFPSYTADGKIQIPIHEGDTGLYFHTVDPDTPIWVAGRGRKGFDKPSPYIDPNRRRGPNRRRDAESNALTLFEGLEEEAEDGVDLDEFEGDLDLEEELEDDPEVDGLFDILANDLGVGDEEQPEPAVLDGVALQQAVSDAQTPTNAADRVLPPNRRQGLSPPTPQFKS
ncbi:hypothetical protein ACFQX6_66990 [Streptosporangium lutulentum]